MNAGHFWSEADIAMLTELWNGTSLTAREIALKMGHGLSRSAIIGRAHRLNLKPRAAGKLNGLPRPAKASPAAKTRTRHSSFGSHPKPPGRRSKGGVSILEVVGCRYPIGHREGVHVFCDATQAANKSYCDEHQKIAIRPWK
jgi:hypothetical protein